MFAHKHVSSLNVRLAKFQLVLQITGTILNDPVLFVITESDGLDCNTYLFETYIFNLCTIHCRPSIQTSTVTGTPLYD